MLFMVIEHFKDGNSKLVGERFKESGRMMPEGVIYHASWLEPAGDCCFQVMEAPNTELLDVWMNHWSDLMEFEVIPVLSSRDFWAKSTG